MNNVQFRRIRSMSSVSQIIRRHWKPAVLVALQVATIASIHIVVGLPQWLIYVLIGASMVIAEWLYREERRPADSAGDPHAKHHQEDALAK